jgi:transcriptional regulator with XRE-family HTH domain
LIDLSTLAWRAGRTRRQLAADLGVTAPTLERYLKDNRAPAPIVRLLEVYAGAMPWPGFERMQVMRGAIYYRDNVDGLPAREIPAYHYQVQELAHLRIELARYRNAPAQYLLNL